MVACRALFEYLVVRPVTSCTACSTLDGLCGPECCCIPAVHWICGLTVVQTLQVFTRVLGSMVLPYAVRGDLVYPYRI